MTGRIKAVMGVIFLVVAVATAVMLLRPQQAADEPAAGQTSAAATTGDAATDVATPHAATAATPAAEASAPASASSIPTPAATTPLLPLPPTDAAVAGVFDELKARAEQGDVRAACRLAADLQRCGMARGQSTMAQNVEGELARGDDSPDATVNNLARLQDRAEQEGRGCDGLTAEQLDHAFDLQLQAAQRDPALRVWFALNPALDAWNFVNDLERWATYRQYAMPWLEEAAARGEPEALIALARVHGDLRRIGPPFPRFRIADEEKFLVYAELMSRQGIRFGPVTRDVERIRAQLDAAALQRVAERVMALQRRERPVLAPPQVQQALTISLRPYPRAADCAAL
jgi:hypothetical protein